MIALMNNPIVKTAVIILVVFGVGWFLYMKWVELLKKQEKEPVFIRKVRNAKKPGQFSGQTIPVPENGSSYTFMTWLHVSDWDYRRGKWKHIFHKGGKKGGDAQPGVWIDPNKNDLHIRFDIASKPPIMKAKKGYPQYMQKLMDDHAKSFVTGKKDPNIIFKENGYEMVGDKHKGFKKVKAPLLTYSDILRIEPNAEEIIVMVPPGQKLTKNTVPSMFIILKENTFHDVNSRRNLLESRSANGWNGETYFTLNPANIGPSLNPMSKNAVTITEGLSNNVENFPLNRWFHLAVICNDRSCDAFIDGKLYKSTVLNNFAKQNNGDLFVTQDGGFGGMITQLRYYNKALPLSMIKFIYDLGPDPPQLPDLNAMFNAYKPKFNIKLDVGVSVNGEEYDVDEMVTDTVKKGVDVVKKGVNKVGQGLNTLDSNL